MELIGTHGTSYDNVEGILAMNFKCSVGKNHWCGEGAYFFVEGVNSTPIADLAEQWAIDSAYQRATKSYEYNEYAVLGAKINAEDDQIFDLRETETQKKCNEIRDFLQLGLLKLKKTMTDDVIWQYIIKEFNLALIVKNDYIKFGLARLNNINSRIDNCTIASVVNTNDSIDVSSIILLKKGNI